MYGNTCWSPLVLLPILIRFRNHNDILPNFHGPYPLFVVHLTSQEFNTWTLWNVFQFNRVIDTIRCHFQNTGRLSCSSPCSFKCRYEFPAYNGWSSPSSSVYSLNAENCAPFINSSIHRSYSFLPLFLLFSYGFPPHICIPSVPSCLFVSCPWNPPFLLTCFLFW